MNRAIRQYKGRASVTNRLDDVGYDLPVSFFVGYQSAIDIMKCEIVNVGGHAKGGMSLYDEMTKRRTFSSLARRQMVTHRSTLHENNRVMAVLSSRRRSQANNELRFDLLHYLLEAEGSKMVALVGNHMPVLSNTVLNLTLALQALQ
jgi:hypothetical protein